MDPEPHTEEDGNIAEQARLEAPVVWLLGKVQSGKSSIVQTITACSEAEVGNGFQPCTSTARVFDFPTEAPAIRFLDTRGLGEIAYDSRDDLAFAETKAHVLMVVMRALDPQQSAIVDVVKEVRNRHPEWPVIVAQTCLHEGYHSGKGHLVPYPFDEGYPDAARATVPGDLARALAHQRSLFEELTGTAPVRFVPIDFTKPEDDLAPQDYGMDAFVRAFDIAPPAIAAMLAGAPEMARGARSARARPHILGFAAAAAAADVAPVVGLVAVPVVQGKMLHNIGLIYGIAWSKPILGEFTTALGASTIARSALSFGVRSLAKLIPGYGQTIGAIAASSMSYAATYALGVAACHFLDRRRRVDRRSLDDEDSVAEVYRNALRSAFERAKEGSAPGSERADKSE